VSGHREEIDRQIAEKRKRRAAVMPSSTLTRISPLPVVEELRRLGFAVLTMYEDGKANQSLSDERSSFR